MAKNPKYPLEPEARRKIGYKNPPDTGKFKEGKSGNPGGRPKKKRDDLDAKIIARCESKISNSTSTVIDVVLNGAFKSAARGDMRAVKTVLILYQDALRKRGQSNASDEADIEAAKRILDLDPRLFSDLTDDEPVSPKNDPADENDDTHDE